MERGYTTDTCISGDESSYSPLASGAGMMRISKRQRPPIHKAQLQKVRRRTDVLKSEGIWRLLQPKGVRAKRNLELRASVVIRAAATAQPRCMDAAALVGLRGRVF